MHPSDKAKELIEKFRAVSDITELFRIGEQEAIKCAIILCDEMILETSATYWVKVKSAVEEYETKNR